MPVIKAKKIPKKRVDSAEDILARFCYHFPQYKLHEAKKLPYKRVAHMLKVAHKEQAKKMVNLVHIASAQQSRKGRGIKKMLNYLQNIIDS